MNGISSYNKETHTHILYDVAFKAVLGSEKCLVAVDSTLIYHTAVTIYTPWLVYQ